MDARQLRIRYTWDLPLNAHSLERNRFHPMNVYMVLNDHGRRIGYFWIDKDGKGEFNKCIGYILYKERKEYNARKTN